MRDPVDIDLDHYERRCEESERLCEAGECDCDKCPGCTKRNHLEDSFDGRFCDECMACLCANCEDDFCNATDGVQRELGCLCAECIEMLWLDDMENYAIAVNSQTSVQEEIQ